MGSTTRDSFHRGEVRVVEQHSSRVVGFGCRRRTLVADSKQAVSPGGSLAGNKSRGGSGRIGCGWCIYRRPNLEDEEVRMNSLFRVWSAFLELRNRCLRGR